MAFGPRTTIIRITVDGGDVTIQAAMAKVRAAIKKTDTVRIENRRIIVEISDRFAEDAAPGIARRLRERLDDYHVDVEIDD